MPHVEAAARARADERGRAAGRAEARGHQGPRGARGGRAVAGLRGGGYAAGDRALPGHRAREHARTQARRRCWGAWATSRRERMGDDKGAFEAFEQALAVDGTDDDLRARYVARRGKLGKWVDAAKALGRVVATVKDPAAKARASAQLGEVLLRGGDAKRAKAMLAGVLASPDAPPDAIAAGGPRAARDPRGREGPEGALRRAREARGARARDARRGARPTRSWRDLAAAAQGHAARHRGLRAAAVDDRAAPRRSPRSRPCTRRAAIRSSTRGCSRSRRATPPTPGSRAS